MDWGSGGWWSPGKGGINEAGWGSEGYWEPGQENGASGNPVEGDQVDRASTGMEGRTRIGEGKRTDKEERRKAMQETDPRETAGDFGR